jgi:hypothetical protein
MSWRAGIQWATARDEERQQTTKRFAANYEARAPALCGGANDVPKPWRSLYLT